MQTQYTPGTVLINPTNGSLFVVQDPNQFFSESWQPDTDAGRAASPWYQPGGGGYVSPTQPAPTQPPSGDTTTPPPSGTTPPAGYSTVYNTTTGDTQQVPTGDVEYWRTQGWSSAPPVAAPTAGPMDYSAIPSDILGSPGWTNLTTEQKNIVLLMYKGLTAGDAASKADAAKNLEEAIKLADPYFKSQIRLAQDELDRTVGTTLLDAQSQQNTLTRRAEELRQDLAFGREDLSIEERSDLARQLQEYEQNLETLQTNMQESGLAFSSPRQVAESKLQTQQQDVAQSTSRQYARQKRDLELTTERGLAQTSQQQADLERKRQEAVTSATRAAEQTLGSKNLPSTAGGLAIQPFDPNMPITGTLEQQRQAAILQMEEALKNRQVPISF